MIGARRVDGAARRPRSPRRHSRAGSRADRSCLARARLAPAPPPSAPRGMPMPSSARLSPYVRGVIYGLFIAGYTCREIADEVTKPDGSHPSHGSVAGVIREAKARGGIAWGGEPSGYGGRPRATSDALDKKILGVVLKHRGSAKVTVAFIKKTVKEARRLSDKTVSRRLGEAGLAWLRRRRKTLVSEVHRAARIQWAEWVLARTVTTLSRWAYTDGTVFYLARDATQQLSAGRAALGTHVWRQADGSDAMYQDCVGPSAYWKAQGLPVRIWGLLAAGKGAARARPAVAAAAPAPAGHGGGLGPTGRAPRAPFVGALFIYVLPDGEVMNRWWYEWIIRARFPRWLAAAFGGDPRLAFLVQDHEKALWTSEPREAMRAAGIRLLEAFPKCSQDLNAIETAWREVRNRLYDTMPVDRESRKDFVQRLRRAVAWVNVNRAEYLQYLCNSQKERAQDILDATPPGARTKW